jgi:hypothetical protein
MRALTLMIVLIAAGFLAGCAEVGQSRVRDAEREKSLYGGSVPTVSRKVY